MENLTEETVEECMQAIMTIRRLLNRPYELVVIIRDEAYQMISAIDAMKRTGLHNRATDLDRIKEHLERICFLSNQMEAGGLIIEGDRALQAAYKRLP